MSDMKIGVEALKEALRTIPSAPGVYRMIGGQDEVLYVGKALDLKKRVSSYGHLNRLSERMRLMVSQIRHVEILVTGNEAEALLLEANLVRRYQPRFNILLRDDKSYPWIMLTGNHPFPRIMRQRGKQVKGASYWGPFASSWAAEQTIQAVQRSFLLRTCSDNVFSGRSRPCLLYQIKRCAAPCVGRISEEAYHDLVEETREFLSGGVQNLQSRLTAQMIDSSEREEYERAALIRDRLRAFSSTRSSSAINPASIQEADVIALAQEADRTCVQVFFIRGGRNNGNRAFYPDHRPEAPVPEILMAFLSQFYEDKQPPKEMILSHAPAEAELLREALSLRRGGKVTFSFPKLREKKAVLDHAVMNAKEALSRHLQQEAEQEAILRRLAELCGLSNVPDRIEVYDNSHLMGQAPYGVMVVAGPEGFRRNAYRKFAIKSDVAPGDDFGMMREVMKRRFGRLLNASSAREAGRKDDWARPDLLLIDGGKGQVSAVEAMLEELGLGEIPVLGIAKGPDRNAGREWFIRRGKPPFQLPLRDPVLYYLQRLRDESHRFAITTHRAGRSKKLTSSELNDIPGIGPIRRKALLGRFGSTREIIRAEKEELKQVPGISEEIAEVIYYYFRPDIVRA